MFHTVSRMINSNIYPILITVICFFIFLTNYEAGTYLTGWDNVQTDLNPSLGVKRALWASWQEYQSFGLVAGLAHASDIIRSVFIWFLSFFLPQNTIRYVFHTLMICIGSIGVFKLLNYLGLKDNKTIFSFFGSLFYIFNFGSVQIMSLPLESFSVFFAMLPWQVWIVLKTVETGLNKTNILMMFIVFFLSTSQAYVQTIFIILCITLATIIIGLFISRRKFIILWRGLFVGLFLLLINLFWILPQGYFFITSSEVVTQSKSNYLATDDTFYTNKDYGTLENLIHLRGLNYDLEIGSERIFNEWQNHFEVKGIQILFYIFFIIFILGLLTRFFSYKIPFLLLFFVICIGLLSNTLFFEQINTFIREISIIDQIFRSPFTKFIIPFSLVYSVGIAFGIFTIFRLLHSIFPKYYALNISLVIIIVISSLGFYINPVFKGFYYSPFVKVSIPSEYFSMFRFFNSIDKNKRVALLPEYTIWGWFDHKWGYNGSGFIWYGIEQPIVSRTFDVWSQQSEQYYFELRYALNTEDIDKINAVLSKYKIDYIILDKTFRPIGTSTKALKYDFLENYLFSSSRVKNVFNTENLQVFEVEKYVPQSNFLTVAENLPNIGPKLVISENDVIFQKQNNYRTKPNYLYSQYYPFINLTSQNSNIENNIELKETENIFTISKVPHNQISLDDFVLQSKEPTVTMPLYFEEQGEVIDIEINTTFLFENNKIEATFPKVLMTDIDLSNLRAFNCNGNTGSSISSFSDNKLVISSKARGIGCLTFEIPEVSQKFSYILKIESENRKGRNLFYYVTNNTSDETYIENYLENNTEYIIIPPQQDDGVGYTISLLNNSYESLQSINTIKEIKLYFFPYETLKNLILESKKPSKFSSKYIAEYQVKKNTYYKYEVDINSLLSNGSIILWQSFHQGWSAYVIDKSWHQQMFPFIFYKEKLNHYSLNNWANGWDMPEDISENSQVVILFWPQYLQYFGYFLLLIISYSLFFWVFHENIEGVIRKIMMKRKR